MKRNRIFVRSGNASIDASPELVDLVETLLDRAFPSTKRELNQSMNRLFENAKKNWIVRQKNSKGSIHQLQKGILIEGDDLVSFVRNNAPYAWAIKTGFKIPSKTSTGSVSSLPEDKRLSNELLWKPVQKSADEVAEALADDLMRAL